MLFSLNSKWRDCKLVKLCFNKQLPIVTVNRSCKYYQNNYNSKIEEVVNIQIKSEQQAGQGYLNMAVTFLHPSKSQFGAGGFFMKMYNEELDHMQKLINYQLLRGGTPLISGLEPPNQTKDLTLLEAFKQGVYMEKKITALLEEGVKIAEEVKDYHYADFITSVFLTEQMRSIHEMVNHVTKLTAFSNNDHSLYQYDLELEKCFHFHTKLKMELNRMVPKHLLLLHTGTIFLNKYCKGSFRQGQCTSQLSAPVPAPRLASKYSCANLQASADFPPLD